MPKWWAHGATRGDRNEENPATENEIEVLMRRACARALSPRSFFAAGAQLTAHSQPALRTGLMAPDWRPALYMWEVTNS